MEKVVLQRTGKRPSSSRGSCWRRPRPPPTRPPSAGLGRWGAGRRCGCTAPRGGSTWSGSPASTAWQGERDVYLAEVFSSPEGVVEYLESEEPWAAEEVAEELELTERLE